MRHFVCKATFIIFTTYLVLSCNRNFKVVNNNCYIDKATYSISCDNCSKNNKKYLPPQHPIPFCRQIYQYMFGIEGASMRFENCSNYDSPLLRNVSFSRCKDSILLGKELIKQIEKDYNFTIRDTLEIVNVYHCEFVDSLILNTLYSDNFEYEDTFGTFTMNFNHPSTVEIHYDTPSGLKYKIMQELSGIINQDNANLFKQKYFDKSKKERNIAYTYAFNLLEMKGIDEYSKYLLDSFHIKIELLKQDTMPLKILRCNN